MSEKQFEGKSAIIIGATLGIGKAIALEFALKHEDLATEFKKYLKSLNL